jgi:hypothetical protein
MDISRQTQRFDASGFDDLHSAKHNLDRLNMKRDFKLKVSETKGSELERTLSAC